MAHARGGDDAMRPAFQTALLFLAAVGLAALGVAALLTAFIPVARVLNLTIISPTEAVFILRMLTLQIVLGLLNGVLLAGLGASGRFAFANTADATRQALEFAAVAAGVGLMHLSARDVSMVYAASAALMLLFNLSALRRAAPAVLSGPWRPSREVLARIWRPPGPPATP